MDLVHLKLQYKKGELTNGTYTPNQQDMLVHVDGKNSNEIQFLCDVDANNLWVPSLGNVNDFANNAKVPI